MPYLFICVKNESLILSTHCFTDSYINCSCQGPKGYCKNEDDGLSLQRKNEHEMKIKTNINPYNRHVMKRLLMISWLFTLGWTLATAQENDSIKHKDTRKCIIFSDYEQQPSFPGGMQALREYLKENTHWPLGHEEDCISGRVVVCFVVEKDGSITHAKVVRSVAPAFDAEALRVVASMPKWMPGRRNGKVIRVKYYIPITFKSKDTPISASPDDAPATTSPSPTSINEAPTADQLVTAYDLQGVKRYEGLQEGLSLPSGTYIVQTGKESKKIIIP